MRKPIGSMPKKGILGYLYSSKALPHLKSGMIYTKVK